jgi:hypothetical protein
MTTLSLNLADARALDLIRQNESDVQIVIAHLLPSGKLHPCPRLNARLGHVDKDRPAGLDALSRSTISPS